MHNWLIFQYHHIMRPYQSDFAKGMLLARKTAGRRTDPGCGGKQCGDAGR
jgi:hypothetical protein